MSKTFLFPTVSEKIQHFIPFGEMIPGFVIIHKLDPFETLYMSPNGLGQLGVDIEELKSIGLDYHQKFFNNEYMTDFVPKLKGLLQKGDTSESITFFQQVRLKDRKDWAWHLSSTRIFMMDDRSIPTHTITVSQQVDNMNHISNMAKRLMDESVFFNENLNRFLRLGPRAKLILKLVSLGKTSHEIADELFISIETVHTHRKLIKKKLGISTTYQFTKYAQAFDLI